MLHLFKIAMLNYQRVTRSIHSGKISLHMCLIFVPGKIVGMGQVYKCTVLYTIQE
jgi:hypothetical protein